MVTDPGNCWQATTHDWALGVDTGHLARIRRDPSFLSSTSAVHLLLEVLAYPENEAVELGSGHATVTLHADGSFSVADDGRGTDTRIGDQGQAVRKPVMSTQDLRLFGLSEPVVLPDGLPRRGMSVVAALSDWLVYTNRRILGSWTQQLRTRRSRDRPDAAL
jgi:topoisomerase IV subunit B